MEKTIITQAIFYVSIRLLKILVKRTDNKIDDKVVEAIEETFGK